MDAQIHTLLISFKRSGLAFKVCVTVCNKKKTADTYLEISVIVFKIQILLIGYLETLALKAKILTATT